MITPPAGSMGIGLTASTHPTVFGSSFGHVRLHIEIRAANDQNLELSVRSAASRDRSSDTADSAAAVPASAGWLCRCGSDPPFPSVPARSRGAPDIGRTGRCGVPLGAAQCVDQLPRVDDAASRGLGVRANNAASRAFRLRWDAERRTRCSRHRLRRPASFPSPPAAVCRGATTGSRSPDRNPRVWAIPA